MKKAAKETLENNMHKYEIKEIIAKAYLSNHKCSVQEAVYHILPELKRRRIFPAVCFVNTNLPEERVQVLFPNYQGISQIFWTDQLLIVIWKDQVQQPTRKRHYFKGFLIRTILAYYTLVNKYNKTCQYRPYD